MLFYSLNVTRTFLRSYSCRELQDLIHGDCLYSLCHCGTLFQFKFLGKDIGITFTLLGPAPIKGDTGNGVQQVDLELATNRLAESFYSGEFQIYFMPDGLVSLFDMLHTDNDVIFTKLIGRQIKYLKFNTRRLNGVLQLHVFYVIINRYLHPSNVTYPHMFTS